MNEFSSVFLKVQHSHSRHQKTTSDLLKLNLRGTFRFSNERPLSRWSYVHEPIYMIRKLSGHPDFFFKRKKKNEWFQIFFTRLLEFIKLYKQNPLENFYFHYLPIL